MSKGLQVTVYVDEAVSSIASAREYANRAERCREEAKRKLWGMVTCTPRDIASDGEDPMEALQERFDDIWDTLWDSFIDEYKYSIIADDAEFNREILKELFKDQYIILEAVDVVAVSLGRDVFVDHHFCDLCLQLVDGCIVVLGVFGQLILLVEKFLVLAEHFSEFHGWFLLLSILSPHSVQAACIFFCRISCLDIGLQHSCPQIGHFTRLHSGCPFGMFFFIGISRMPPVSFWPRGQILTSAIAFLPSVEFVFDT